jgi:hypothetical protein
MGKASSAKKVARAARAGSSKRTSRPRLTFPLAIAAVLVVGGGTVVYARQSHDQLASADTKPSYKNQDHWHSAYGFYVCDKFEAPLKDATADVEGIHTHEDGLIHNHPFKATASGERARMKVWAPVVGVKFFDDGWKLPNGNEYRTGSAKCGDKAARVAVYHWKQNVQEPIEVFDKNFGDIFLSADKDAYTFAVLPEDAPEPAPKPESIAALEAPSDVQGAGGAGGAGGLPEGVDLSGLQGAPGGGVQVPVDPSAGGAPAPTP